MPRPQGAHSVGPVMASHETSGMEALRQTERLGSGGDGHVVPGAR
jgi:hypothetical protein